MRQNRRLTKIAIFILIGFACIVASIFCLRSARSEYVFYPMGGIPFRIIAYDRARQLFDSDVGYAKRRVAVLESVFSSHREESEVVSVNRRAFEAPVALSHDLYRVIIAAKRWWDVTNGAFDITVGPLIDLWKKAGREGRLPDDSEIDNALSRTGVDNISMHGGALSFSKRGMKIDLGGIAKGDIVDQVAMLLKQRGVKRGIVGAAGDTVAFGDGTFRIGIQDPTAKAGEKVIGEIEMPAGAIVTSGNYERYATIGGKKYSHIIDPRNGRPLDNGLEAVTVLGRKCIDADALATGLMVLGRERAVALLKSMPDFEGILVEKNGDQYIVWVSRSLVQNAHFEEPWANWIQTF